MTDLSVGHLAAGVPGGGLAPFLVGLGIAALLVWAVWFGIRVRGREQRPPRPEEQPRLPAEGPVGEVAEHREPDEVPKDAGRLTPRQVRGAGNASSTRSGDQRRRRWIRGRSGSFGSGGK
ncbi:DUF6479 family protein [Streptomyces sp. NPDC058284]|uniref:DUF6479 family protein n=1 Tax=unclassified Streptomyces TaxID=2593676 RepID=UPI0036643B30